MKRKLLSVLLIMVMSMSIFAGCGSSGENGGDKENSIKNEEEKNEDDKNTSGIVTFVCEATNYNTGDTIDFELAYDSSVLELQNEPENIADEIATFYHKEIGVDYDILAVPMCPTASEYYSIEKDSYDEDEKATFSELTTYMVGDIQTQTYNYSIEKNDGKIRNNGIWILEFEDGVIVIDVNCTKANQSDVQKGLKDLLCEIKLGGLAPITAEKDDTTTNNNSGTNEAFAWLPPQIEIDGVVYTFPMEAKEFVDNGWVMDTFPAPARPGANAGINFKKGDLKLFTNVSSTTGTEQPMEEGEVCSMSFSKEYNSNISVSFPGGIKIGSTKAEVESVLPNEYVYDASKQCFKYIYDDGVGKYDIKIYLTDDESTVEEISYTYWTR